MKVGLTPIGLLLASLTIVHTLHAQPSTAPEPILQVTIDPPRVVVGQKTTLRVQVLAPNYMTAPPELPNFQVRNAVTRQLQSVNRSEQRSGTSYAGVQFEFAIYPQEAGSYAIASQRVTVRYAAEPPATREQTIALPRVDFQAFIPDAAGRLRPFLSASHLTIEQSLQRSSEELKPGDAVTRIVTIKAEGTPAMLLPPVTFSPIDGLKAYPAQPSLEDKTDSQTDALYSTRTDSAIYMLQRPGDYLLPGIDVAWWNIAAGKVETAHLDGVALRVADNLAAKALSPVGEESLESRWDALIDHITGYPLLAGLLLVIFAALAWMAPMALQRVVAGYRRHLQAYRQSEVYSFRQLRAATRRRDASAVYFALIAWLQRFASVAPVATIDSLKQTAHDPQLAHQLDALQTELFARGAKADWSPRRLFRGVDAARRSLRRQSERREDKRALPQRLNPVEDHRAARNSWRTPAR